MKNDQRQSRGRQKSQVTFPVAGNKLDLPMDYQSTLKSLKERIANERLRVTLTANAAMVMLYWDIGQTILERQEQQGWGAKIIDRLSEDLKEAFPEMSGFSPRNLKYMRRFASEWPHREMVQEPLAQITWYHNLALLEKCKEPDSRLWYARKTVENGWNRNVLALQIESQLTQSLPDDLKGSLPSIEEIEKELEGGDE